MSENVFFAAGQWMRIATCPSCKMLHAFPESLYQTAQQRKPDFSITCPNGHAWHYTKGESDLEKMRRERDRAVQRVAEWSDAYEEQRKRADLADRRASAAKGQITKIKKRAAVGVCPCCNRTFSDLARHMAGKHPGYVAEPTADEHVVN